MKRIVKLSLILLATMCIMGNVYATINCNVNIVTAKTEYSENEEFTVDVNLTNIQSEEGVIALGGTLEYDKESLTLEKMEGKNGWSNPSYNEANGKFVMDRDSATTSDETIFTITFKVKENSKENLEIALKNITVSDGEESNKIELVNKAITIKNVEQDPGQQDPEQQNPETQNPDTHNPDTEQQNPDKTNTNKPETENKAPSTNGVENNGIYQNGSLPKTGEGNIALFIVPIVVFAIIIIVSFARIKIISKKERM